MSYVTLEEFKRHNESIGNHWFSEDTMRFFDSRVETWDGNTGLFITSEVNPSGVKAYSIRRADFETGRVSTVGVFHSYKTLKKAQDALTEIIKQGDF